jgi:hypothetical protein
VSFLASRTRSAPEGVDKPVRRREDPRLVTGGGLGVGGEFYPEDFLVPHLARRLGRPVGWRSVASPMIASRVLPALDGTTLSS